MEEQFEVGQVVHKTRGYSYPGVVVAKFRNLRGEIRYVVECTVPAVAGMLHIYSGGQLAAGEPKH